MLDGGARGLVLSGKTALADELDVCLSPLGDQPDRVVAVPVPRRVAAGSSGLVEVQNANAWAIGGVSILHRHAVSRARILQRISLSLCVRRRSLSVFGKFGNHRSCRGRHLLAVAAMAGGRSACRLCRVPSAADMPSNVDLAAKPDVLRHRDALSNDNRAKSRLLDGLRQPRRCAGRSR